MGVLHGSQLVFDLLFFFLGSLLNDLFFISKACEHFHYLFLFLAFNCSNLIQSLMVISVRTLDLVPQLHLNLVGLE